MYGYKQKAQSSQLIAHSYNILKIGLTAPRQILNNQIDARVLSRLDQGMVEETKKLHQQDLTFERMRQLGLEYGCLADLLEGKITQEQFTLLLQTKIHQYAKRQMTWFKRDHDIYWYEISQSDWAKKVEKQVASWYD
jgi:tRNA dimethylallyltransferase